MGYVIFTQKIKYFAEKVKHLKYLAHDLTGSDQ